MSRFPRPEGFVQSLRMRRRGLQREIPLIVVEGPNDRQALFPFLSPFVQVVAAEGREQVLKAYNNLDSPLRERVVFIVDCDGSISDKYKGHLDLVITTNRDIEADLLFELQAFDRVGADLLAQLTDTPGEAANRTDEVLALSAQLATSIGLVHAAARQIQLPTRVVDKRSGKRRKFRLADLPSLPEEIADSNSVPTLERLVTMTSSLTLWDEQECRFVVEEAERVSSRPCEAHEEEGCAPCQQRRHCNGHHFVDGISVVLRAQHDAHISSRELNRALRVAARRELINDWEVAKRLERWGVAEGVQIMANSPA